MIMYKLEHSLIKINHYKPINTFHKNKNRPNYNIIQISTKQFSKPTKYPTNNNQQILNLTKTNSIPPIHTKIHQ